MKTLSRQDITRLIARQDTHCVSLYLPTHRKGQEVLAHQDQLRFKEMLNKAEMELTPFLPELKERVALLRPALDLQQDTTLWHTMLDTLVVFLSDRHFSYYQLPYSLPQHLEVSHDYYLLPLLARMSVTHRYLLLQLGLDEVHLFDVTPGEIREINTESLVPHSLAEAVGTDHEQKYLHYRGQNTRSGTATFFGQGEGKDDRKTELIQYLQSVDRGLNKLLPDEPVPMVVAAVGDVFGAYKKVNSYHHLWMEAIEGSPEHAEIHDLAEKGWEVLKPYFEGAVLEKVMEYREGKDRTRMDSQVESVVAASVEGKVDTLFVSDGQQLYGRFDRHNQKTIIHNDRHVADVDLLNMAAMWVFDQKGTVYLLPPEQMPEPDTMMNAIYRY